MRDFGLEVFFSKWEFRAKHHMTASDVESMSVSELCKLADVDPKDALFDCWLGYTETYGDPKLRELIADTYDNLSSNNIVCFAGAEEGIYAAMRVLLDKDDHAIVVVPNYQAAETLPLDICEVTGVSLLEAENWDLDLDQLEKSIKPNTKLVSINFPNNPTGKIINQKDYTKLIDICRKHGIYLFSDEVYRLLELDETKRIPQAADMYEKALSLNVMSKAYGLPGLRIGWIASQDKEILEKLVRYKHYLSICNSALSEKLAIVALEAREKILNRNREILRSNLTLMNKFFSDYENLFDWQPPDGSCVSFPKFTGAMGVENFCAKLLEENGVFLMPASICKSELLPTPQDRFRIGFGRKAVKEGLDEMRSFLDRHHNNL